MGLDIGELVGRISLEDAFSGVLEKVEGKLGEAGEHVSKFGEGIKESLESPFEFAKSSALSFVESLGPIGVVAAAGAVAVGALGAGMYELAEHAAEAGEQIEKFNLVTGVSVEKISELKAVADIGGSSLDSMQSMLFQVERRMQAGGEAANKFNNALADMKISSEEFRTAAPDEKIKLLSEGLHNAQGSATMMADAIAVMGRGARENLPFLLKNMDELEERAHRVAYVWTDEDVEASKEFSQQSKELGEGLSTVATTVGVALLPAMTSFLEIVERTGEAIINVSGIPGYIALYKELKGWLGEDELALETQGALVDMMDRRWAAAAKSGLSLGDATYKIANDMLTAGYSVKTIAEQTGLAENAVQGLKGQMEQAAKAAISSGEAWERVNEAFAGFSDVEPEVRGLVKDMFDAKVSIEDMSKVVPLSKEQLKALTEQFKEAEKTEKEFTKAWDDLNSLGVDFKDTLAGISPAIADTVKYYASMGAKVEDLVKAFPELTKAQAEAAVQGKKAADEQNKLWTDIGNLWEAEYDKKAQLEATDSEKIVMAAEKEYEKRVKTAQDAGIVDVTYYNELWALRQADVDNNQASLDKQELAKKQAYLKDHEARNQEEEAIKQHMANIDGAIDGVKAHVENDIQVTETLASAWSLVADGVDATKVKVKALSGEMETLAEAQKRFDMGSSFTYDLSTPEGLAQYKKMNPAATISWSDSQIEAYIKKGGTLQGLIATGVIFPYGGMHADMGGEIKVGEHGPEIVHLPVGSTITPTNEMGGASGGGGIHIHPGAIVLNYPIMQDRAAMSKFGDVMSVAMIQKLRDAGWRPSGPVNR